MFNQEFIGEVKELKPVKTEIKDSTSRKKYQG